MLSGIVTDISMYRKPSTVGRRNYICVFVSQANSQKVIKIIQALAKFPYRDSCSQFCCQCSS